MNDSGRMKAQVRLKSPSRPPISGLRCGKCKWWRRRNPGSSSPQTLRGSGGACRTQLGTEHQEQVSVPSLRLCLSQPDLRHNSRSDYKRLMIILTNISFPPRHLYDIISVPGGD